MIPAVGKLADWQVLDRVDNLRAVWRCVGSPFFFLVTTSAQAAGFFVDVWVWNGTGWLVVLEGYRGDPHGRMMGELAHDHTTREALELAFRIYAGDPHAPRQTEREQG